MANIFQWKHSPTVYIDLATDLTRKAFMKLGNFIAYVSNFYIYIDKLFDLLRLKDLGKAISRIIWALFSLLLSPFWTLKGYIETLDWYENVKQDYGWWILFGTITLIATGIGFTIRYRRRRQLRIATNTSRRLVE